MRYQFVMPVLIRSFIENLSRTGRSFKQAIAIVVDMTIVVFAVWLAYSLRFQTLFTQIDQTWQVFLLVPIIVLIISMCLGIYSWVVRSSTSRLYFKIVEVAVFSSLCLLALLFLFPTEYIIPRSLFAIFGICYGVVAISVRVVWQWMFGNMLMLKKGKPTVIYGAGSAGRLLLQILMGEGEYLPVLFIDDNPSLHGTTVSGLRVLNPQRPDIVKKLQQHGITTIVLAMPSVKGSRYRAVLENLEAVHIPIKVMPSLAHLLVESGSAVQMRDVSIEDLLGRDPVLPDIDLMGSQVKSKTVLVTGGGGSIGSELCRQICALNPKCLIVLEQSEENLYQISENLEPLARCYGFDFVPILGSVCNKTRVQSLFSQHRVNTVYHAAAYKHVPIIEKHAVEGVQTNIFGTALLLDTAISEGVDMFVLISTDKAVRPANIMGATKRVAEMVLQARADSLSKTKVCAVRFGNVLGSSGSVIPKFTQQITNGGPVTVTHPEITRYFMTIPEASQLVLQAGGLSNGGEVFVLDMGEPVKILSLAESLIRLHGLSLRTPENPEGDVEVQFTQLRDGEKLYEELFLSNSIKNTNVSKIFLETVEYLSWKQLEVHLDKLKKSVDSEDHTSLREQVMSLAFLGQAHAKPDSIACNKLGADNCVKSTCV